MLLLSYYIKHQTLHFIKHDNKQTSYMYKPSLKGWMDRPYLEQRHDCEG